MDKKNQVKYMEKVVAELEAVVLMSEVEHRAMQTLFMGNPKNDGLNSTLVKVKQGKDINETKLRQARGLLQELQDGRFML